MDRSIAEVFRQSVFIFCLPMLLAGGGCIVVDDSGDDEDAEENQDLCATLGRYGDGVCDTDCRSPDPDCDGEVSSTESSGDDDDEETQTQSGESQTEDGDDESGDGDGATEDDESGDGDDTTGSDETGDDQTGDEATGDDDETSDSDESDDETSDDVTADDDVSTTGEDPIFVDVPTLGSIAWSDLAFDGAIGHVPAVDTAGNMYFVVNNSQGAEQQTPLKVVKVSSSGSIVWTWSSEQYGDTGWFRTAAALTTDESKVFFNYVDETVSGSNKSASVALDVDNGEEVWRHHPRFPEEIYFSHRCYNAALRDDLIVYPCDGNQAQDGFLTAINEEGEELWQFDNVTTGTPVFDTHGNIVTCSEHGSVYGLAPADGDLLWSGGLDGGYDCTSEILVESGGTIHVLGSKFGDTDYVYKVLFV